MLIDLFDSFDFFRFVNFYVIFLFVIIKPRKPAGESFVFNLSLSYVTYNLFAILFQLIFLLDKSEMYRFFCSTLTIVVIICYFLKKQTVTR